MYNYFCNSVIYNASHVMPGGRVERVWGMGIPDDSDKDPTDQMGF